MSDLESSTAAASTAGPSTAAPSLSSKRSKGKSNGLLITTPLANSTTGSSPEDPRLQSIKSPLFKSISNFAVHINVRRPSEKAKLNDETLADMLDDHLNTAMKSKTLNKGTLTFDAKDVEQAYRVFFLHKNLISWQVFAGVNILLIILAEALLFSLSTDLLKVSPNEYAILNGAIVLAPTIIIMGLTLVLPKQFLEHWIHFFSVLFLLFVGPILSCGHYFIAEKSSYSLAISGTVYILEIFSCVYFLQIRFLYTVGGVILLAIPSWFLVFALALKSSSEARIGFIISTIASVLTLIIVSIMSYKQEKAMRYQFISDQQFLTINMKLHDQLSGLIKGYSNKIADLDSPLEKAIYGIKSLLASPSMSIEHLQTLQLILACLNSTNILTPDFDSQMRTGGIDVTDEQKMWILHEISNRISFNKTNNTSKNSAAESLSKMVPATPNTMLVVHNVISNFLSEPVKAFLKNLNDFNFPIFEFNKAAMGRPLTILAHSLIVESGLSERLHLPLEKLMSFLEAVESSYDSSLAFHNSLHAADVLHCIHFLYTQSHGNIKLNDTELLSMYIAAIIHDVDHPGVSNNFLIATLNPMTLLYNDKSVLENHHCSTAFTIVQRTECNFLQHLEESEFRKFRSLVVDMVLATDLAQHFSLLTMFKKRILTPDSFEPTENREDKVLYLQMLMKCSDVSNPTKAWSLYSEWIDRITSEFLAQGDKEKQMGLPISPFCNREASNKALSQKSFINFIVGPLYDAMHSWRPLGVAMEGLTDNRKRFCPEVSSTPETGQSRSRRTSLAIIKDSH